MTLSAADFKHGDSEFGIFYPTGYVLSVFPDVADADRAVTTRVSEALRPFAPVVLRKFDSLSYTDFR